MALIVLQPGAAFDPRGYYAAVERSLPVYARPLFVRVATSMDVTGTLKHTKGRLQSEGYDLDRVADPIFLRDDAQRTYVRFDAEGRVATLTSPAGGYTFSYVANASGSIVRADVREPDGALRRVSLDNAGYWISHWGSYRGR